MAKGSKNKRSALGNSQKAGPKSSAGGLKAGINAVGNFLTGDQSTATGALADAFSKAESNVDAASEAALKQAEENLPESIDALVGELKREQARARDLTNQCQAELNSLDQRKRSLDDREKEQVDTKKTLDKERKEMIVERKALSEKEGRIADQWRDLEDRLLDAEAGFAAKNNEMLEKFRAEKEVEAQRFEEEKVRLRLELDQLFSEKASAEKQIKDDSDEIVQSLRAKTSELDDREEKLHQQQEKLDRDHRRLVRQTKGLDQSREEMREEIRIEFQRNLKRAEDTEKLLQAQIDQYASDEKNLREQIAAFAVIQSQFGDESPQAVLTQLRELKDRNDKLAQELSLKPSSDLEQRCKELRDQGLALESLLDKRIAEVSEMKRQVSQSRVAVVERESLAKEKLVLEKHNEVLGGKIDALREEVDELLAKQQSKSAFPALVELDRSERHNGVARTEVVHSLKDFAEEMQHRIAWDAKTGKKLFYRLEEIQLFIAGLSMSRLHILQGISGTGKTSLAQAFSRAVGGGCETVSVQAGWRDKDDIIGHYNSFEKQFYERPCLQGLYEAQTPFYQDRPYIVLLDEMNLSRPEQYFAEFLSALELDPKKQLLSLMTASHPSAPKGFLEGRKLQIPRNVWFIGTANHDETTFEFADKTYDRAHVMELPRNESDFEINKSYPESSYSFSSLEAAFDKAVAQNKETVNDILEVLNASDFVDVLSDKLSVSWGNRLERQAKRFMSTLIATGGRADQAMDHLLATKVLRHGKATGRYDTEREDIEELKRQLDALWKDCGFKADPTACHKLLENEIRRKSSH